MPHKKPILVLTIKKLGSVQTNTEPYYLIRELRKDHDIHVFAKEDPGFDHITYHSLPKNDHIPNLFWYNILLLPLFAQIARKHKIEVVYSYKTFILTPWILTQIADLTWIADFRTAPTGQRREFRQLSEQYNRVVDVYLNVFDWLYRVCLSRADAVITLSERLRTELIEKYQLPSDRTYLLPLGVDTDQFDPQRFEQQSTDSTRFVYLGTINKRRGIDDCIRAFAELIDTYPNATLHLIGSGPSDDIKFLKKVAAEHQVQHAIEWHGYHQHEKIPALLATMDIAMSPLPPHESFEVSSPAKVFEYLAMSLPIVCSDIAPHSTLVAEGESGFFFDPDEPDQIENAMIRAIEALKCNSEKVHQNTRALAVQNDWSERIDRIRPLLSDQIDKTSKGAYRTAE